MDSESCIITTKNRFINQSSSLHFEQKISLNGHCDGLPPRSTNYSQRNPNPANDQKRWSTSYSKRTGDSTTTASQFDEDDPKDSKLPSYVGISCTISGYSSYSRYCSSVRGSYSRGSSPIMRNYEVIDGPNVVQQHHHFHHQLHHNNNHLDSSTSQQQQQQNQFHQRQSFIKNNSSNNWSRDDDGGCVPNHTHNELICGDLDYDDDTSGSSEKSLVQRRIESLYGSNVAEVWRDSRSKVRKVKKMEMINNRSPSCPPHALRSKECSKKSPAVFSHLNEKFLSKIDSDPKTDPVNGLINSLNEVLKVNGTKTNGTKESTNGFHLNRTNVHNDKQFNNQSNNGLNGHSNGNHKMNGNGLFNNHHQHSSGYSHDGDEGMDQVDKVDVVMVNDVNGHHLDYEMDDGEVKKGEMYLKKLEDTIGILKVEITKTENLLETESHLMNEEITGNVLSAIGKGNLLVAQKLNQFRDLCHANINGGEFEQFATKNEDLDGFWEMVFIQVEDVLNGFQEIYKLKQNNWIILMNNNESPTSKIIQPKTRSPRKSNAKSSPDQQSNATTTRNTVRDEMRKQRLREAKLKSQSRLQGMKQSQDDVVIFVPPNGQDDSLILVNDNGSKTDS